MYGWLPYPMRSQVFTGDVLHVHIRQHIIGDADSGIYARQASPVLMCGERYRWKSRKALAMSSFLSEQSSKILFVAKSFPSPC